MSRIKLKQCEKYSFYYNYVINVRDINYGGHLSNDAVVGIIHESRIHLLQSMGFTELDLGDKITGLIMVDLAVNFVNQGFMLETLKVFSQITEIKNSSFRICSKLVKEKDNITVALIETGLVAFDYKDKIVSAIPEIFLEKINELQGK